jgi:hypothetical protein
MVPPMAMWTVMNVGVVKLAKVVSAVPTPGRQTTSSGLLVSKTRFWRDRHAPSNASVAS